MNKIIILFLILIQLSSCSFHSSQLDLLKSLLIKEDSSIKPEKNWTAYWVDEKIDLYAINIKNQIIFADEHINIFFKDKQIYKITGLLPNNLVLEIYSIDRTLEYIVNGKKIRIDSCEERQSFVMDDSSEKYSRSCSESKSGNIYENQIIVDSEGMIISMQFKVHPDYPILQLSMK
tara:strand:- start:4085 stop:4612 length:528 start_codon:yes stop_codon:yes gene_type:complete